MAAQAEGLNDFHRKMADAEAAVAERLQERGEAGLVDGGGGNGGAAGGGAGRAPSQGASPYEGRSQDVAIRQALETGSHASSALGARAPAERQAKSARRLTAEFVCNLLCAWK